MADMGIFIRVVRGETSMMVALVVTTLMLAGYFAYEIFVPSFSDVFVPFFRIFRISILTYTIIAIHNACHDTGVVMRMLARTYVVVLVFIAAYWCLIYYGVFGALVYPVILFVVHFLLRD